MDSSNPPASEPGANGRAPAMTQRHRNQAFWIVAYSVMAIVGLWLTVSLFPILIEIVLALILATGLRPVVEWLARRKVPHGLAIGLVMLSVLLIFAGFLAIIVPQLVTAVQSLITGAPQIGKSLVASYTKLRETLPFLPPVADQIQALFNTLGSQIPTMAGTLVGGILSVTTSVVGSIVSIIFIVSMLVIFLGDGAQVEGYVLSLVSTRYRERVKGVMDRIGTRSGGWLVGQLSLMLAMGLGAFIILTVLGVPGAAVLALVTALFELIPAIGPMIAVIPAALVAFAQSPLLALAVVALYFVMHQIESAVLVPNLMGRSVHLHPLAVLIAVIAFTSLFGVLGAVIAPATAVAVDEVLREWRTRMDAASDVATPSVAPAEQRMH